MFRHKTVMIVGAGASCEAKLPAGDELRVRIVNALRATDLHRSFHDVKISQAIADISVKEGGAGQWPQIRAEYLAAAGNIISGLPLASSIDHFLDAHAGNKRIELLGKLAIGSTILAAEKSSVLVTPGLGIVLDPDKIQNTWYAAFGRMVMQGVRRSDIRDIFKNLTIVSFNYDRCIEHFLFTALQSYFSVDAKAAAEALSALTVIHPYGSLGSLPWQEGDIKVPYGVPEDANLLAIAGSLKTFTESIESGTANVIKEAVASASTLIFLGFGFHPQNVDLLSVPTLTKAQCIFATMGGISAWDRPIARSLAASIVNRSETGQFSIEVHAQSSTCTALFDEYRLMLTQKLSLR
ncbi:MAG: hypothetical protein WBR13_12320 [Allosphingosinicella sp.]